MARITASVYTSHVPAIGAALDMGKTEEPYWQKVFQGYEAGKKWIKENEDGRPWFNKVRADEQTQTLEEVGAKLRAMMPFLNPVTHKPEDLVAPAPAPAPAPAAAKG